jgi:hypothetical protein
MPSSFSYLKRQKKKTIIMGLSSLSAAYLGHSKIIVVVAMLFFITSRNKNVQSFQAPFSSLYQEQRQQDFSMTSRRLYQDSIVSTRTNAIVKRITTNDSTALSATSFPSTRLSYSDQEDEKMQEEEIETEISSQNKQSLKVEETKNNQLLPSSPVSKFRQLKDVMWIRETLEDWTAAEFALSVEQQSEGSTINGKTSAVPSNPPSNAKKRAVDYEKLLSQLTKRVEDMTCHTLVENELTLNDDGLVQLDENLGMGRYSYSNEERMVLLGYVQQPNIYTHMYRIYIYIYIQ